MKRYYNRQFMMLFLCVTASISYAQKKPKETASFVEKVMYVEKLLENDKELEAIKGASAGNINELKYDATYTIENGKNAYVINGSSPASFAPKTTYQSILFESENLETTKLKWLEYKKSLQQIGEKKWKDQLWKKSEYDNYIDDYQIKKVGDGRYEIQLILEPSTNSKTTQVKLLIIVY